MASPAITLDVEEKILEDAIASPAVAMMRLSLEVDRELRLILATLGRLKDYAGPSPTEALDLIEKSGQGLIPQELRATLKDFWNLRNMVVHGPGSKQHFAMRAVDYGLRILRMLRAIPRPWRIVRAENVPLCSDSKCVRLMPDVRGVILESFSHQGESHGLHIYPSRIRYILGQKLSWEWDTTGEGWNETWYKDPFSDEIKLAWSESMEFVGRPLERI